MRTEFNFCFHFFPSVNRNELFPIKLTLTAENTGVFFLFRLNISSFIHSFIHLFALFILHVEKKTDKAMLIAIHNTIEPERSGICYRSVLIVTFFTALFFQILNHN